MSNVGHVGFVRYPGVLLTTGNTDKTSWRPPINQGKFTRFTSLLPCYNEKDLNSIQAKKRLHKTYQIPLLGPNLTLPKR